MLHFFCARRLKGHHLRLFSSVKPLTDIWPISSVSKPFHRLSAKTPPERDDHHRLEFARINTLLLSIDRVIRSQNHSITLEKYVLQSFSSPQFQNPSRCLAFNQIIRLLLRHRQFKAACYVYDQMIEEGILASPQIRLKMLAIAHVWCSDGKDQMMSSLAKVFLNQEYDECCLHELLDFLAESYHPKEVIESVVHLYAKLRNDDHFPSSKFTSRVIDMLVRGGLMSSAKELLNMRVHALSGFYSNKTVQEDVPYPYITLIKGISDTHYSRMTKGKASRDGTTYNALIATWTWRRGYAVAFECYRRFRHESQELESMSLRPDARTFKTLFKALRIMPGSRQWRWDTRGELIRHSWPRALYRDLLSCHLIETRGQVMRRSSVVNPAVLNGALRMFMVTRDYPAAFVVARSFRCFKVLPTLHTYQIVLRSLIAGIRLDVRRRGMRAVTTGVGGMLDIGLEEKRGVLYEKLLELGKKRARCSKGEESGQNRNEENQQLSLVNSRSRPLPTLSMLTGREPVPPMAKFDSVPLERILRRIICAAVDQISLSVDSPTECRSTGSVVENHLSLPQQMQRVLVHAKLAMIPGLAEKRKLHPSDEKRYEASRFLPIP